MYNSGLKTIQQCSNSEWEMGNNSNALFIRSFSVDEDECALKCSAPIIDSARRKIRGK
jgi:hypothetical protein